LDIIEDEDPIDEDDEDSDMWDLTLETMGDTINENQSLAAMTNSNTDSLAKLVTQVGQPCDKIVIIEEEDVENSVEQFNVITFQDNESHAKVITSQNNKSYAPPIFYKKENNIIISTPSKTTLQNAKNKEEGHMLMSPKNKITRVIYDSIFPKASQVVRKKRKVEEYYYYYPP